MTGEAIGRIFEPLRLCARHGRLVLAIGLVAGIAFPGFAQVMKPWLPEMIALLLFIAALRIGPRQMAGGFSQMRTTLLLVALFQLVIPCALALIFGFAGLATPIVTAIVLMASASTIAGSPNLALLTRNDPAAALRLLVAGTALLPLTVVPVFWLSPILGSPGEIGMASARLTALIVLTTLAAFALRRLALRDPAPATLQAIDGLSALAMAIVVVGLMSAIAPAIRQAPDRLLANLVVAFAANFGLQLLAFATLWRLTGERDRAASSIAAGNRNMALFLTALPAGVTDPLLLFIGCYQVPMYLTPLLLGRLYAPRRRT